MDYDLSDIWTSFQDNAIGFANQIPAIFVALVVFVIFVVVANQASKWAKRLLSSQGRSLNAATVVALLTRWSILIGGLLVALSIAVPSFQVNDLIQILGVTSIAIGFAFRDIFQNFLAGIIILLTDTFVIGDQIIVVNEGLEGTVTEIDTRATTIKTYDDRDIIIPNSILFTNPVTVNTSTENIRSEQMVGISYGSDIDTAVSVLQEAIKQVDGVLADPAPDVLVEEFGDSSVNLRARWWTQSRRNVIVKTKSAVTRQIKYTLDENGIEIPFPIRTLYVPENVRVSVDKHATDE